MNFDAKKKKKNLAISDAKLGEGTYELKVLGKICTIYQVITKKKYMNIGV